MYTFEDLKQIMKTLRAEDGCPWDRAQDHDTLKKHLVEECAEVLEAIDAHDTENLCEELGDVLFQVMFHSEIEAEQGNFTVDDVVNGICEKMIRRHPRVFGGEIPACRRAARLPQDRAEARIDEGARAPRRRILLQHSDEHAAVPPERRIGRHPGVKERGAGSHRRKRKETSEGVSHEDVRHGAAFQVQAEVRVRARVPAGVRAQA